MRCRLFTTKSQLSHQELMAFLNPWRQNGTSCLKKSSVPWEKNRHNMELEWWGCSFNMYIDSWQILTPVLLIAVVEQTSSSSPAREPVVNLCEDRDTTAIQHYEDSIMTSIHTVSVFLRQKAINMDCHK